VYSVDSEKNEKNIQYQKRIKSEPFGHFWTRQQIFLLPVNFFTHRGFHGLGQSLQCRGSFSISSTTMMDPAFLSTINAGDILDNLNNREDELPAWDNVLMDEGYAQIAMQV
jgi:hypothetical protein